MNFERTVFGKPTQFHWLIENGFNMKIVSVVQLRHKKSRNHLRLEKSDQNNFIERSFNIL